MVKATAEINELSKKGFSGLTEPKKIIELRERMDSDAVVYAVSFFQFKIIVFFFKFQFQFESF